MEATELLGHLTSRRKKNRPLIYIHTYRDAHAPTVHPDNPSPLLLSCQKPVCERSPLTSQLPIRKANTSLDKPILWSNIRQLPVFFYGINAAVGLMHPSFKEFFLIGSPSKIERYLGLPTLGGEGALPSPRHRFF